MESQRTKFDHERKWVSQEKKQPLDIVKSSVEDRPVIRFRIIKTTYWEGKHLPDERTIMDRSLKAKYSCGAIWLVLDILERDDNVQDVRIKASRPIEGAQKL